MRSIKFLSVFFLVIFLFNSAMAQQDLQIAVLDFENQSTYSSEYSKKAADWMISELTRSGKVTVVERKRLDALMLEQDFQASGHVDPQTAINIGKMIGADVIVLGTIDKLGISNKTIRVGDSKIKRYMSFAEVSVRAVNVQSGAIIFSDSDEVSFNTKSASVPGFDMGSNAPSVDVPLKKTIKQLSKDFINILKNNGSNQKKPSVL